MNKNMMKTLMVCLMILMGNVAQAQDVKDILRCVGWLVDRRCCE